MREFFDTLLEQTYVSTNIILALLCAILTYRWVDGLAPGWRYGAAIGDFLLSWGLFSLLDMWAFRQRQKRIAEEFDL
jgi:hypothetical protein